MTEPTEVAEWIAPNGEVIPFDYVDWSLAGRFMPKIIIESEKAPGQPGEFEREIEHGTREFLLPFEITGTSEADLRTKVRAMIKSMDPKRGVGRIRFTTPVGDQREIRCRNASGLEGQEELGDASGFTWQAFPATFLALDPYWYDVSPTSQTFTAEADTQGFFPFFPLNLTESEIVVQETINNTGDVHTWPQWTITGPGSVIKLTNLTTGKFINFPLGSITAGQTISIDTAPRVKSVLYNDGTSAYSALAANSSLWPLEEGVNVIRLEMSGIGVDSKLDLRYWRRYLSS